jgi:hypothetical protein
LKKVGGTYVVPDKAAFEAAWKDVYKNYEGKFWPWVGGEDQGGADSKPQLHLPLELRPSLTF